MIHEPPDEKWRFRVYIAGMNLTAQRALKNLESVCDNHLAGKYSIEVIDLLENPKQAEQDQVFAIPTVVRQAPLPRRKIIGDLSHVDIVLEGLDIQASN